MLFGGIIIILFEVIAWIKELEKGFFRPISLHMITTKKKKPQITKKHFITSFVVFFLGLLLRLSFPICLGRRNFYGSSYSYVCKSTERVTYKSLFQKCRCPKKLSMVKRSSFSPFTGHGTAKGTLLGPKRNPLSIHVNLN